MMNVPFLLQPAAKDYLWGGSRLNDDFGKTIPAFPLAETWECSTHPDGLSVVAGGEYAGKTLRVEITPVYGRSWPAAPAWLILVPEAARPDEPQFLLIDHG